ncbi:hypothetical protein ACFXP7_11115 [Microbacterium sp. P06]|uniref:DUF6414 family protein n=1 Tax=Microbacterium sp. P06 TaxID=3366949 RepID=UPI003744EABB
MSYKSWRQSKRLSGLAEETKENPPLREFVYLDAVSLHSLLVSQNATIPSEVSQAISRADEAELSGSVATKVGSELVGGSVQAESSARYQTSNSNSMQSSRKAVIQTLFKELRELPLDFKLATPKDAPAKAKDIQEIAASDDRHLVEPASSFVRGELIEVDVTLAVDPVFKLGAMMTEWSAMADELPAMFGSRGLLGFLRDSEPIMKVLDRFLAGLIPIKATATNYVVAEIGEHEFIVHKAGIDGLDVNVRPLHITGVTEHIGYWKDIRRVLFSGARFTILGRVARDGIHKTWTPVKLADLFSEVAPEFVDQINAIRSPSPTDSATGAQRGQQVAFAKALDLYRISMVPEEETWTDADELAFTVLKARYLTGATDASVQRRAFDEVRAAVSQRFQLDALEPARDLAARQSARSATGLELFPSFAIETQISDEEENGQERPEERLIDVEVIAIYW